MYSCLFFIPIEFFHCRRCFWCYAFFLENFHDSLKNNLTIQTKWLSLNITNIVVKFTFPTNRISSIDLCKPCQSWANSMALFFYYLSSLSRYLTKNILSLVIQIWKLFYFGLKFSVKKCIQKQHLMLKFFDKVLQW